MATKKLQSGVRVLFWNNNKSQVYFMTYLHTYKQKNKERHLSICCEYDRKIHMAHFISQSKKKVPKLQ